MGLINTSTVKPTLMDLQVPTEKSSMESTLNSPIPNDFDQQQQQEEGDEDKLSQSKAETLNNNNNNPIWVDWSENDSENPFNFSNAKKWKITIITCSFTVLVAISGTSFPSGEPSMERAFGNEQELSIVAYIMAPLGFGLTPLFMSPLSEVYGRYWIYVVTCIVWILLLLPLALGKSIATIIIFRFLSGCFASSGGTIVAGSISDLWQTSERGPKMSLLSVAAFVGSSCGPLIGGFTEQYLNFRYIQWIQIGMAIVMIFLLAFGTEETRASKLLSDRAKKIRKATGDERYQCKTDAERASLLTLIKYSLTRPLYLLFTEPVLFFVSLWVGFSWANVFLSIVGVNEVFKNVYNFSDSQAGLVLLTIGIASLIGAAVNLYQEKLYLKNFATRGIEARLYTSMAGSVMFPLGQLIFAISQGRTQFAVPLIGLIISYAGVFFIYLASINYLVDVYTLYAASAMSAQSLFRNILGAMLPLFAGKMYDSLGYTWGSLIPGIVGFILAPVPFVLFIYGPKIRLASKFSQRLLRDQLAKEQEEKVFELEKLDKVSLP